MRHYRRVKEGLALLLLSFSFVFLVVGSFLGLNPMMWTVTVWMFAVVATGVIWVAFITTFPYVEDPPKSEDQDIWFF